MKTTLSFGLMVAAASTLFACSDEGTGDRATGTGGTQTANAGTGGTGTGNAGRGGGAGTAGTSNTGGSGGAPATAKTGPALVISDDATVLDVNGTSGINGAALPITSMVTTLPVLTASATTGLCISGQTVALPAMPAQADYTNNWGASMSLDLNRGANPNAPTGDAGADAGDAGTVLGLTALPWDPKPGKVIGFSFKLVGKDPAITPQAGVPPLMRFQAAPTGGVSGTDNYCYTIAAPTNGGLVEVLFSQIVRECYNATPGPGVLATPYPAGFTGELQNVGWQVNSASSIAYRFNFCVTELAPIIE